MFHIPILMADDLFKKVLKKALTTSSSFNYIVTYEIFVLQKMLVVK